MRLLKCVDPCIENSDTFGFYRMLDVLCVGNRHSGTSLLLRTVHIATGVHLAARIPTLSVPLSQCAGMLPQGQLECLDIRGNPGLTPSVMDALLRRTWRRRDCRRAVGAISDTVLDSRGQCTHAINPLQHSQMEWWTGVSTLTAVAWTSI